MESTWLTKTLYKNALAKGNVYMSTAMKTGNGITGFNVYIKRRKVDNVQAGMWRVIGHSSCWSDSKECYHVVAWGTSRPLEVILSIGHELGLRHGDMKQNWTYL